MPRPHKCRNIGCDPQHTYFKPRGIPVSELEQVSLAIDELEAMRLADLENLYHEDAAKRMNVSRQTFDRIILKARVAVTDALINGKAIKIAGGNVMLNERTFACSTCSHKWKLAFGTGRPNLCPSCQSADIHRAADDRGPRSGSAGRGMGGNGRCMGNKQRKNPQGG